MASIRKRYALTGELGKLVTTADRDPDRVSMLTLGDEDHAECSIVVIKGHAEVELFRQWAERNGLLDRSTCFCASADCDRIHRVPR